MPEGTPRQDGRLLPLREGFVHLATATGFPVVPVLFHDAHRNWEKGTFRFQPMDLDVEVLPPIDTSGWREATAHQHAEEVHALFTDASAKVAAAPACQLCPARLRRVAPAA